MFIRTPGYCSYGKRQEVSGCRTLGMLKLRPSNFRADYSDLQVVATPVNLPLLPLLLSQCIGRINLGNLQGWEDCGQQRYKHEGKHHGGQSWRIVDAYAVQYGAHHP